MLWLRLLRRKRAHGVRAVTQALGGFFNLFFRVGGDIPGQRRIIQDDRNRRRGKARGFGDIPHGDQPAPVLCFHARASRAYHPATAPEIANPKAGVFNC